MPLRNLNDEQKAAATAEFGHNLVIASAGTGKTSTIVARIAHLLNLGISPEKILLLTFTNKAASEMIGRLNRYFDKAITSQITAGTFHAVSYMLLKRQNSEIALKEPSELKILLKSLIERRKFDHISDTKPYGGAYLYDVYSLFQNKELNENFASWFARNYEAQAEFAEIYADVLEEFEAEKRKFGYVDFNDLLLGMRRNLADCGVEFDEILVDEYQDTNSLQGSLIDAFKTKSLFCVGDYDQSIYAFNGANIDIINTFEKRYNDARVYLLKTNYRSSGVILALANKVIAHNPRLHNKELIVSRSGEFKKPRLLIFGDLMAQYNGVAELIERSNYDHHDIAVIFRNNASADGMEAALKIKNIPTKRKAGVGFFESAEIRALINLISLQITKKDLMAFMNIMEFAKKVGNALSKELFDAFLTLGNGNLRDGFLRPDKSAQIFKTRKKAPQLGLFDDIDIFDESGRFAECGFDSEFFSHPILRHSRLSIEGAKLIFGVRNLMLELAGKTSPFEVVKIVSKSQVFETIKTALASKRATQKSGKIDDELFKNHIFKINSKCEILLNLAKKHSEIFAFYNFLTLGAKELNDGNGVNLLSVHASKGLEFGQVFVVDLAQNRFPNLKLMGTGGSIEEERRLFYVAVTRAKDELVLSYAKNSSEFGRKAAIYEPSQFLKEAGMVK